MGAPISFIHPSEISPTPSAVLRVTTMARRSFALALAVGVLAAAVAPQPASAQAGNMLAPPGSMTWQYECKDGTQCPTRCAVKGTELFSSSNYKTLTIVRIPEQAYWIRIDTGQGTIDYVAQADEIVCSMAGAALKSGGVREGGTVPAPR